MSNAETGTRIENGGEKNGEIHWRIRQTMNRIWVKYLREKDRKTQTQMLQGQIKLNFKNANKYF